MYVKNVKATEEASIPQRDHPTISGSSRPQSVRINPDPDSQRLDAVKIEKIVLTCPEQFRAPWTVRDGPRLPWTWTEKENGYKRIPTSTVNTSPRHQAGNNERIFEGTVLLSDKIAPKSTRRKCIYRRPKWTCPCRSVCEKWNKNHTRYRYLAFIIF